MIGLFIFVMILIVMHMNKSTKYIIVKFIIGVLLILGVYLYENSSLFTNTINKKKNTIDNSVDLLNIYYMDVGEADSTLIRYQNYNVLIDGGNTVDGKKLVSYYKSIGVDHFDYVIATHSHEDHIGGLNFLLRKFKVSKFYIPSPKAEWKSYENVWEAIEEKNISYETPEIDSSFDLGDLHFDILWIGDDTIDLNQNSIVLMLTFKNTKYLFMADAESEVEKELLEKDIKCDVLKVGHHGSQKSSSAQFLYKVSPGYAIISVGKDNEYGFPKQVVLDKLERIGSTIYRTDLNHTIHVTSDGENISIDLIETDTNGGDRNES